MSLPRQNPGLENTNTAKPAAKLDVAALLGLNLSYQRGVEPIKLDLDAAEPVTPKAPAPAPAPARQVPVSQTVTPNPARKAPATATPARSGQAGPVTTAKTPKAKKAPAPVREFKLTGPTRKGQFLVIVESPTKARKLEGLLRPKYGDAFTFKATMGHMRDMPRSPKGEFKKTFGVNTKTWEPDYERIESKDDAYQAILKAAIAADVVYLASDPDREGEAIGNGMAEMLEKDGVDPKKMVRCVWNAISLEECEKGFANAREIDRNMVAAQETRRIYDRMFGYTASSLLADGLGIKGLSAGRVQTSALKMIMIREDERELARKNPIFYGAVTGVAEAEGISFKVELNKAGGLKVVGPADRDKPGTVMLTKEAMAKFPMPRKDEKFYLINATKKPGTRGPKEPFTTTTMQAAASIEYGLSTQEVDRLAQILFEESLITYHRSDSPNVTEAAILMARDHIAAKYGPQFVAPKPRQYKATSEFAQAAHECIRPTHLEPKYATERARDLAKAVGRGGEMIPKLLDLITQRFVACQMADKAYDTTTLQLGFGAGEKGLVFKASGNVTTFPGWTQAYSENLGEEVAAKAAEPELPLLKKGDIVKFVKCETAMRQTQPPPAHNQASVTKAMGEKGIGRSSTYGAIFTTLEERGYVECKTVGTRSNVFVLKNLGRDVVNFMDTHFPEEMDLDMTANFERELFEISEGERDKNETLDLSYQQIKSHSK